MVDTRRGTQGSMTTGRIKIRLGLLSKRRRKKKL